MTFGSPKVRRQIAVSVLVATVTLAVIGAVWFNGYSSRVHWVVTPQTTLNDLRVMPPLNLPAGRPGAGFVDIRSIRHLVVEFPGHGRYEFDDVRDVMIAEDVDGTVLSIKVGLRDETAAGVANRLADFAEQHGIDPGPFAARREIPGILKSGTRSNPYVAPYVWLTVRSSYVDDKPFQPMVGLTAVAPLTTTTTQPAPSAQTPTR